MLLLAQTRQLLGATASAPLLAMRDAEGRTPLLLATAGGHCHAVAWLLAHGSDCAARDGLGLNALHYAAARCDLRLLAAVMEGARRRSVVAGDKDFDDDAPPHGEPRHCPLDVRLAAATDLRGRRPLDAALEELREARGIGRTLDALQACARLRLFEADTKLGFATKVKGAEMFAADPELGNAEPRSGGDRGGVRFTAALRLDPAEAVVSVSLRFALLLVDSGPALIWPGSCVWVASSSALHILPALRRLGPSPLVSAVSAIMFAAIACGCVAYFGAQTLAGSNVLGGPPDEAADARALAYSRALEADDEAPVQHRPGADASAAEAPSLCSTCEIERPLRSSHCARCGRCVRVFDHCCAWTGCCIGEHNHGVFLIFVAAASLAAASWLLLLFLYVQRAPASAGGRTGLWAHLSAFLLVSVQPAWMLAFGLLILFQHSRVISRGLTTNEARKWRRPAYGYLRDARGRFRNPFNRGNAVDNVRHFLLCSISSVLSNVNVYGKVSGRKGASATANKDL